MSLCKDTRMLINDPILILCYNLAPIVVFWKPSAYILSVRMTDLKTEDKIRLILCFEATTSLLKKSASY